jgi:hypothetical protein
MFKPPEVEPVALGAIVGMLLVVVYQLWRIIDLLEQLVAN